MGRGQKLATSGHIRWAFIGHYGTLKSRWPIFSVLLFFSLCCEEEERETQKKGFFVRSFGGRLSFIDHSDAPGIKIGGRK